MRKGVKKIFNGVKNPHDLSWRIVFYVVNPRTFVSSSELFAELVCGFWCKT